MVLEVQDSSFDAEVSEAPAPVVLEFFATWCGNCRRIAPVLDGLAAEFDGRVRFLKVNAEDNPMLVQRFGVSSTPTMIAVDGGRPLASVVGAQPAPVLRELFAVAEAGGEHPAARWVPAEACTLPTADQPLRLAEFDELFASSLHSVDRAAGTWLRLRLAGPAEAPARDLTAREADCCDFFDFDVDRDRDQVVVDVRVPAGREAVLDGLERQARTAGSRVA